MPRTKITTCSLPRRRGRKTLLTPEMRKKIVDVIKRGAYDYVAAQAVGISRDTFTNWMRRGEDSCNCGIEDEFALFFREVKQARAEARARAEIVVKRTNPLAWLRYGPGREREGEPGWTEHVEMNVHARVEEVINYQALNRLIASGSKTDSEPSLPRQNCSGGEAMG